ncbi:MAG TPA: protein phosphatase 2C domain-containing protein, partial [Streptosporangiaceae bacterium]
DCLRHAMPAERPDYRDAPGWRVLTAVVRGAAHEIAGRPLQDAAGFSTAPPDDNRWLALAVADGHGGHPHFRSARGSELAIEAALGLAGEFGPRFAAAGAAGEVYTAARDELVPAVISRWQEAVADDLADNPLTGGEQMMLTADDAIIAYGSTLLLAVLAAPWLALCQIGDGDTVVVGTDGVASVPVPHDPRLDGHSTTSLCQVDAADAFRIAVVNLAASPVAALLLATDGFGNAQTADPWYQLVGGDLVRLAAERGIDWVGAQLPVWAARCASAEGSGDDVALALLLADPAAGDRGWSLSLADSLADPDPDTETWPAPDQWPPVRPGPAEPGPAEPGAPVR